MLTFLTFLLFNFTSPYQDIPSQSVSKSFLIIKSTKNYSSALNKAQLACNKLGTTLNLRNLSEDKEEGLSTSETCGCGTNHGYLPRGRYDDGQYISIEYSSAFEGFTPDYYMVVVASGERATLKKYLPEVQKHYKLAYIKDTDVYMGCLH